MAEEQTSPNTQAETSQLQARIAELERQNSLFQQVINTIPVALFVRDRNGRYLAANQKMAASLGGATVDAILGKTDAEMVPSPLAGAPNEDQQVFASAEAHTRQVQEIEHDDGRFEYLETSKLPIVDSDGNAVAVLGMVEDVTARKIEEQDRLREQAAIIESQASVLAELSTPLIPLREGVLLLPLVGTIDTRRAHQVLEVLLEGISTYQAETAILDITGVRVVDTQVADGLLRAARAAKLLGTTVYLSGISAEVAQTLVQLGASLDQVVTAGSLQNAISQAFE